MLKMHEIREIIKLVDQSSIAEFEVSVEDTKISIKKNYGTAVYVPQQVPVQQPANGDVVAAQTAPAVGMQNPPAQAASPVVKEVSKAPETSAIEDDSLHKIVSPMVGTFYKSPEPGAEAYVKPGDKVQENTIVCIVEAMKLFNEIEAEVRGEVVEVLVEDGQLVEYGQPLFLVKTE